MNGIRDPFSKGKPKGDAVEVNWRKLAGLLCGLAIGIALMGGFVFYIKKL